MVDPKKVTQVIDYLLKKSDFGLDKYKIIKLVWAADRYHVRKYARFVTEEDEYLAMGMGPAGSVTKAIINIAEGSIPSVKRIGRKNAEYVRKYIYCKEKRFGSRKDPDEDYLSETDKEALDFAWNKFAHMNTTDLIELTHIYPEWSQYGKKLSKIIRKRKINKELFFSNPAKNLLPNDPFTEDGEVVKDLKMTKEIYLELA